MPYWWSGPICGLGNRLIAIAAVKACVEKQEIYFPWSIDPSCPGAYEDILKPIPNLAPRADPPPDCRVLDTHGWEPLEIYKQLKAQLKLGLSLQDFCKNLVLELRRLPFHDELTASAKEWRQSNGEAALLGVHIRRTDRAELHREQFRAFVMRKQGLNRELPLYLSAMYGFLPASFMRTYENRALCRLLRDYKDRSQNFRYAVFSDDRQEVTSFEDSVERAGIESRRYLHRSPQAKHSPESKNNSLRKTNIKDSVMDLLCLSECDAILQNNRASTFSLVASIIGARPIISAKTRYSFWRTIEDETSMQPNDPRLNCRPEN
jgi:hypothetical protein